ncbi:hypothetical protein BDY24DRAFT_218990 [Mrakia frigida]|uniref:uncharacterized protein n=1 Tax=Mrakia frigida TaxID=29902 RepID=UPI003FCC146B
MIPSSILLTWNLGFVVEFEAGWRSEEGGREEREGGARAWTRSFFHHLPLLSRHNLHFFEASDGFSGMALVGWGVFYFIFVPFVLMGRGSIKSKLSLDFKNRRRWDKGLTALWRTLVPPSPPFQTPDAPLDELEPFCSFPPNTLPLPTPLLSNQPSFFEKGNDVLPNLILVRPSTHPGYFLLFPYAHEPFAGPSKTRPFLLLEPFLTHGRNLERIDLQRVRSSWILTSFRYGSWRVECKGEGERKGGRAGEAATERSC